MADRYENLVHWADAHFLLTENSSINIQALVGFSLLLLAKRHAIVTSDNDFLAQAIETLGLEDGLHISPKLSLSLKFKLPHLSLP